jgi:hypothetical protein
MYDQDSFFTLGTLGQLGLISLSISMFALCIWAMSRMRAHWGIKLGVALIGFYFFIWFSPQIYYTYYLFIFDGLPLQIVVGKPPTAMLFFQLMTFTGKHSLSAHGLGALGWGMIIAGQLPQILRKCRNAAN